MGDLKEAVEEVQRAAGAEDPNDDPDFQLTQGKHHSKQRRFRAGRRRFGVEIQASNDISRTHRSYLHLLAMSVLLGQPQEAKQQKQCNTSEIALHGGTQGLAFS